jgi:hypothetical protein
LFPDEPNPSKNLLDYETAIQVILHKQMEDLKDKEKEKELNKKYDEERQKLEEENKKREAEMRKRQKEMEEERKKMEEELKKRDAEMQRKMKEAGDDKKKLEALQEKLKREKEEAEQARRLQEEKERLLEEEKQRAMKAFEEAMMSRQEEEMDVDLRAKLDQDLTTMIQMCNDANEYCRALGRYQYFYQPATEIQILPDGTKIPKVVCRAYPDRKKDYFISMDFNQFDDKLSLMNEKYVEYMTSVEENDNFSPELEIREDEGFVFGLSIKDDWHLIGNCYIFLYSLARMHEVRKDHTPIIDNKGEQKGTLCYSYEPIVYDETGEPIDMVTSINEMYGRDINVELSIHYAQGIPEKYSTNVFTEYKWIDIDGRTFKTEYSEDQKNKNPKWEYRRNHIVYVSDELINHIKDSVLVMSVYGKLSPEDIENMFEEYALDPSKNFLLANKAHPDSEEENKRNSDTASNDFKNMEGESKEIKELRKRLEDIRKKNEKLKKEKVNFY